MNNCSKFVHLIKIILSASLTSAVCVLTACYKTLCLQPLKAYVTILYWLHEPNVKRLHVCAMRRFPVSEMKEIKHNNYSLINTTLGCLYSIYVLEATDQGIKGVHIRV